MSSAIASILRAATRMPDEPLNILTWSAHERTQYNISQTGHRFWALDLPGLKQWNPRFAPVPAGYTILHSQNLPLDVDFDLILSHNKLAHWELAKNLSKRLHLPTLSVQHCLPPPNWTPAHLDKYREMKADHEVFITEYNRRVWGYGEAEGHILYHGVETDMFCPNDSVQKEQRILSVCNDLINRNWCCGYDLWKSVSEGLPMRIVGDTPGLSKPAKNVADLVNEYRQARVFLNTSLISPIPTVTLEAAACSLPIVSTNNCALPELVEHGVNGFLSNDPNELREFCRLLLSDHKLAAQMGANARQTVLKKFSLSDFTENWNKLFRLAISKPYQG